MSAAGGQGGRDHRCPGAGRRSGRSVTATPRSPAEIDGDVEEEHAVGGNADLIDQHVQQVGRDGGRHLQPHRLSEPPPVELELHRRQPVAVLVVDGQIGVAGHPEGMVVGDVHGREQSGEMGGNELLDGQQASTVGQGHEAGQDGRHLDPGDAAIPGAGVHDPDDQVEREVGDVGEGMGLVDGQRGQDGEDLAVEDLARGGPGRSGESSDQSQITMPSARMAGSSSSA